MSSAKKPKKSQNQLEEIKNLEKQVYESKIFLNNIIIIKRFISSENESAKIAAINALERIFKKILPDQNKDKSKKISESFQKLKNWIDEQFSSYLESLLLVFENSDDEQLKENCLKIYMDTLKNSKRDLNFQMEKYSLLLEFLLRQPESSPLVNFAKNYFSSKDTLIFGLEYLTIHLEKISRKNLKKTQKKETITRNVFSLLQKMEVEVLMSQLQFSISLETDQPFFSESTEEYQIQTKKRKKPMDSIKKLSGDNDIDRERYQTAYVDFWLSFLRLPLTTKMYKSVLVQIPKVLLPLLPKAGILFEFFLHAYGTGGVTSILALNGIFVLMSQHQLEYPDFYQNVYNLLDQVIYKVKFRERLFHYLSLFLRSDYLPAYLVAAFIKRLARLSLTLPPFGIFLTLGLITNLLQRHPTCRELIHKTKKVTSNDVLLLSVESEKLIAKGSDPYLYDEMDPAKSNAQESSLWELETLKQHYDPDVTKFLDTLEGNLPRQAFEVEELASVNYQNQIEKRIGSKYKTAHLAFQPPTKLFQEEDKFNNWDFSA